MLIWNQLPHQVALRMLVVKVTAKVLHQVENNSFLQNKIDNK